MPAIDHKLASQRIQYQGGNRGLNPVLFDTSAAARVQAPQINPNAANVQYTPVQPGQVGIKTPLEATAEGASKLMAVWSDAATKYADRQHELDATRALQQIQQNHQFALYGDEKRPGYLLSATDEARDKFGPTLEQVTKTDQEILQALPPGARAKAAIKYYDMREQLSQEMIKHRHKEEIITLKNNYQWSADANSQDIAQILLGTYYNFGSLSGEEQIAAIDSVIMPMLQEENARRAQIRQYAPAGTNFNSTTAIDVMQQLITSSDPAALGLAEAIWPHLDSKIDDMDGRTKIHKLFLETYGKSNAKLRADLERDELQNKRQAEDLRVGIATETISRLNDPVRLAEYKQLYIGNKEMLKIINETENTFAGNLAFDPDRSIAISEAMAKELSPVAAVDHVRNKGFKITFDDFTRLSDAYQLNLNKSITRFETNIVSQLEEKLRDSQELKNKQGVELSLVLEEVKDTPPGRELIQRLKTEVGDALIRLRRDDAGKSDIVTFETKAKKYIDEIILNGAITSLKDLGSGPAASPIPDAMRVYKLSDPISKESFANTTNVADGIWQLKGILFRAYANNPKKMQELLPIFKGTSPDRLRAIYEQDKASKDPQKLQNYRSLFAELYRDAQKQLFIENNMPLELHDSRLNAAQADIDTLWSTYEEDWSTEAK